MGDLLNPVRRGPPPPGAFAVSWRVAYASIGWATYLAHPLTPDMRYACGCNRQGPHALTRPTLDPETMRREWRRYPRADVFIQWSTSGLACVGINVRDRGGEELAKVEQTFGPIRGGIVAEGGGGGTVAHIFQAPPNGTRLPELLHLHDGITLHCGGWSNPIPPSSHPAFGRWTWRKGCDPWTATAQPLPPRILCLTPADEAPTFH